MNHRMLRTAASILAVAVVALLAVPCASAADDKSTSQLVIVGTYVIGSEVLVKVANVGSTDASGDVVVDAKAGSLSMRSGCSLNVRPGSVVSVTVGFPMQVTTAEPMMINETADPVL